MDTTIKVQVYIFITCLYGGLIAGFFYDIYRVSRHYFKPKTIATIVEDFIFWIGVAVIFFYILNKSSWIELRAYLLIAFLIGGIIYIRLLSKLLFPVLIKLFDKIAGIVRSIIAIIILPLRYVAKKGAPKMKRIKKVKAMPKQAIGEIRRYSSMIFRKK